MFAARRGRGQRRAFGPQKPTEAERATATLAKWVGIIVDTNEVMEEAWRKSWMNDREGQVTTRLADDLDLQQGTLFLDKTLQRQECLNKAQSSLLVQARTGAIDLRDFLFIIRYLGRLAGISIMI